MGAGRWRRGVAGGGEACSCRSMREEQALPAATVAASLSHCHPLSLPAAATQATLPQPTQAHTPSRSRSPTCPSGSSKVFSRVEEVWLVCSSCS